MKLADLISQEEITCLNIQVTPAEKITGIDFVGSVIGYLDHEIQHIKDTKNNVHNEILQQYVKRLPFLIKWYKCLKEKQDAADQAMIAEKQQLQQQLDDMLKGFVCTAD